MVIQLKDEFGSAECPHYCLSLYSIICKNMSIACSLRRGIDIFMQKDERLLRFVGYLQ